MVKPWLATHAPLGVAAVDLADAGYPLAGGRIAVIGATPVPTLVYQRHEHWIAVTELPLSLADGAPARAALDGFHLEHWRDSERAYVAVSDIDAGELAGVRRRLPRRGGGRRAARRAEFVAPPFPCPLPPPILRAPSQGGYGDKWTSK